jgi:hypothetical protein
MRGEVLGRPKRKIQVAVKGEKKEKQKGASYWAPHAWASVALQPCRCMLGSPDGQRPCLPPASGQEEEQGRQGLTGGEQQSTAAVRTGQW